MSQVTILSAWIGVVVFSAAILWWDRVRDTFVYDRNYDRIVRNLISGNMLVLDGPYTVRCGDLVIWIGNYPYSYGHPYNCGISRDLTLSTRTKRVLRDHVNRLSLLAALEKVKRA